MTIRSPDLIDDSREPPSPPTLGVLDQWVFRLRELPAGVSVPEEQALARRIQAGDEAALARLVTSNLRFAVAVAKRYQQRGVALADLIQEANIGLVLAARRFDAERGVRFITYAVWWVRQCILTAIAEQGRTLRIPPCRKREINLLAAAYRRIADATHSQPCADEVAAEAGLEADRVRDLVAVLAAPLSLDAPMGTGGGHGIFRELGEVVADCSAEEAAKIVEDRDRDRYLRGRLADLLRPRERRVLERYFGLDGGDGATLEQIGYELGVSRERVRQIKEAALKKMQADPHMRALR